MLALSQPDKITRLEDVTNIVTKSNTEQWVFRHLSYCYLTVYIYTYMYVYIYLLNEQVKNHKRLRRMSNIIGKSRSILVYCQSFKKIGPGKKK